MSENTAVWWVAKDSDLDTLTLFETEQRARDYAFAIDAEYGATEVLSDSAAGQLIIDSAEDEDQPEHSERARYVTGQVALWIANDGDWVEGATHLAGREAAASHTNAYQAAYPALRDYLVGLLRSAKQGEAVWHVAQELAPNDYARIHWADVADALLGE